MKDSEKKPLRMLLPAVLVVMMAAPLFVSQACAQQAPTSRPSRMGGRGPSLGGDMRGMGQAFSKIMAQYTDPTQNDSTLTLLATFESQAAGAKALIPPTITAMPEADRAKATAQYRQLLTSLIRTSLDLEDQITAGDMGKAAASIKTMQDIEKSGHDQFRPQRGG